MQPVRNRILPLRGLPPIMLPLTILDVEILVTQSPFSLSTKIPSNLLIYSFIRYLLSIYYVPGTVLYFGKAEMSKMSENLGAKGAAHWYKHLPGNGEVVSSIPETKKQKHWNSKSIKGAN